MSTVNSLMKIDVAGRQDMYLICSHDEQKNHLRIILLDHNDCKAFSGHATDYELMTQAAVIGMVFSDFLSLTLKALTKSRIDGDKFLYCLEKNCESFIFKWKTVDKEETIVNIGSVIMTESDYKADINNVFLLLSEEMANLKEKLTVANENLTDLKKEMEKSMQLLTDMNTMKEHVEKELYSKFILVLNEKKQKIRHLKRERDDTSSCDTNKKHKNTLKSSKIVKNISDSSDESISNENVNFPGPSTSKRDNSFLFFDEPEVQISPSKKRNRNNSSVPKINVCPVDKPKVQRQIIENKNESDDELFNLL